MIWMDVDAALAEVPVNICALIDDTDFKTREESVAYNQAGMDLVWNFVTTAGAMTQTAVTPTTAGVHDWTSQLNGMYSLEIPASAGTINNDTEGFGWFTGFATGVLPWCGPVIGFRAAALNNALIDGGDVLDVSLTEIGGVAQSATDLKDFADAGYDPATNKVQGVVLCDTTTTNTDMAGTDSAALASVCTEARLSELDAATGGKMANQVDVIQTDTTTDIPATITTAQADLDIITGATGVNLLAATQASIDAVETDTNALNDTKIPDTISLAAINAEVDTALDTAIAELGVAAPTATPTVRTALMLMYMALRNKLVVQTSGTDAIELYNNAGTKIASKLITDATGDYTEAEMS